MIRVHRLAFLAAAFLFLVAVWPSHVSAAITCGPTCLSTAQVAQETTDYQNHVSGSKCLFIYDNQVYQPPSNTISGGKPNPKGMQEITIAENQVPLAQKVCGDCPYFEQYLPPEFCEEGKWVAGVLDECGCQGPPTCQPNA